MINFETFENDSPKGLNKDLYEFVTSVFDYDLGKHERKIIDLKYSTCFNFKMNKVIHCAVLIWESI